MRSRSVCPQGLAQSNDSLLGSRHTTLEHDTVSADQTVVWPSAHRVDALFANVKVGSAGSLGGTITDLVDLVVHRGSVVVSAAGVSASPKSMTFPAHS